MKQNTSLLVLLIILCSLSSSIYASIANSSVINYLQPDGLRASIELRGDEKLSWAVSLDGYTLLNKNKGWQYAMHSSDGDLVNSGIFYHNADDRSAREIEFLENLPKGLWYSSTQVDAFYMRDNMTSKSSKVTKVFVPKDSKRLIMILVGFSDLPISKEQEDLDGLMNTIGYDQNGAQGSVKDFFREASYGQFDITTDVVGPYVADNTQEYYGKDYEDGRHDELASELILEAVNKADNDVDFSDYDNDNDGVVDGVYVIFAGHSQASSGIENDLWSKAGSVNVVKDGVTVGSYSCSNELKGSDSDDLTTIGVICHEFGHVCGAPDFYDTDYDTGGQFIGTGKWDVMAGGLGNGNTYGSMPAHFNPYTKIEFGWVVPDTIKTAGLYNLTDITTNKDIYLLETQTSGEYYLFENRQQVGFNEDVYKSGLMIYHKRAGDYRDLGKNTTHPQGFYAVCASADTDPSDNPSDYGFINSTGCPFPGSTGKIAFYDTSFPSSKSWAGDNTGIAITSIVENADSTVSFYASVPNSNTTAPSTQVSQLSGTTLSADSINLQWVRGNGDKVIVVMREGEAVDFDPIDGIEYFANSIYGEGDEVGAKNYVIYNGTGTGLSVTGLNGNSAYHFAAYEYDEASLGYLVSSTVANESTNCDINASTFVEDFESSSLGCWTTVDNTGDGEWQLGTTENINLPPSFNGNYAYFRGQYGLAYDYNTDLISPSFDLSDYSGAELQFANHFDASSTYPSTGSVSYSTDGGVSWTTIASYTTDHDNENVSLSIAAVAGESDVKFKWNYTCTPTGAFMWGIDDVKVENVVLMPTSITATGCSADQVKVAWLKNALDNDVILAFSTDGVFGEPISGAGYIADDVIPGGGTVLYKGNLEEFDHTSLSASSAYYYKVWSMSSNDVYSVGVATEAMTDCDNKYTLPFEEHFSSAMLPDCWRLIDSTGNGGWQFGTTSINGNIPDLTGNYAYLNTYENSNPVNADLISPSFDLTEYSSDIKLSFKQHFIRYGGETCIVTVYYSIDNGLTWTSLYTTGSTYNPSTYTSAVLSDLVGESHVKFKWNYTSTTANFYWAIDDVTVSGMSSSLPSVKSLSVKGKGTSNAVAGGDVVSLGSSSIIARGVCWSELPSPTVELSDKTVDGSGSGIFHSLITGVDASKTYYVRAYATNASGTMYGTQNILSAAPIATNASGITTTDFVSNWGASEQSSSYSLDVSTTTFGNTALVEDFDIFKTLSISGTQTDVIDSLLGGDGWSAYALYAYNSGYFFLNSSYSGQITTPTLDLSSNSGDYTVYFDVKQADDIAAMRVMHASDGVNFSQVIEVPITEEWGTEKVLISGGTSDSKVKLATTGVYGSRLYLDNLRIEVSDMILAYTSLEVNSPSQIVDGLTQGTYYYRVRTIGDNTVSLNSNVVSVSNIVTNVDGDDDKQIVVFNNSLNELCIKGNVSSQAVATLYNAEGKVMINTSLKEGGLNYLTTGNYTRGMYLLVIKDAVEIYRFKILLNQ